MKSIRASHLLFIYLMLAGAVAFAQPVISNLHPSTGSLGTVVTISGNNFDPVATNNAVFFNGMPATVLSGTATSITTAVPANAFTGPVKVVNSNGSVSSDSPFNVCNPDVSIVDIDAKIYGYNGDTNNSYLGQAVAPFATDGGPLNQLLLNAGKYFISNGAVGDCVNPQFTAWTYNTPWIWQMLIADDSNDEVIFYSFPGSGPDKTTVAAQKEVVNFSGVFSLPNTATVDLMIRDNALSDNDGGVSVNVQPIPDITSINPASGPVGTVVTLHGSNLGQSSANTIVYFGATQAEVTLVTSTSLKVKVPYGATFDPVTVTINGFTATSPRPFLVTFAGGGDIASTSFANHVDFSTNGNGPQGLAIADIDGDGISDLITTGDSENIIEIFLNASTPGVFNASSLQGSIAVPAGIIPYGVATGDLDGDGDKDIVVSNYGDNSVSVLLNNSVPGSVSFSNPVTLPVGENPTGVVIADLNSDDKPEVIVVSETDNEVFVFKNNPGAALSFADAVVYNTGFEPIGLAVADIDDDGKPEIIVAANDDNAVSVLRNVIINGQLDTSSFEEGVVFSVGSRPMAVAVGDLNQDGLPEIVTANHDGGNISVLKNTTSGTISFAAASSFDAGSKPNSVAIGDINGDGLADVVAGNGGDVDFHGTNVSVFQNTSTATSISFDDNLQFDVSESPTTVAIGDLDNDGLVDIVSTGQFDQKLSVLRNAQIALPIINVTTQPQSTAVCNGGNATFVTAATGTTNIHYNWEILNTTTNNYDALPDNSVYLTPDAATLTINTTGNAGAGTYRCKITGDLAPTAYSSSATLTINTIPSAPTATDGSTCGGAVTVSASGGTDGQYRWYATSSDVTPILNQTSSTYTTNITATTIFYVSLANGSCESPRVPVNAILKTVGCATPPVIVTQTLNTSIGGSVTLNLVPLITTTNGALDVSSIEITSPPNSGAEASVNNGILTIDYNGLRFDGQDQLTIRACDINSNCAQQIFYIDVAGDITVYNALSPGGANPTLQIQYIDVVPDTKNNKVTIFDRWQNKVWEGSDYDNSRVVFAGASNAGSELPTGIYYYKIEFASGRKAQTGYISLKR